MCLGIIVDCYVDNNIALQIMITTNGDGYERRNIKAAFSAE